MNKLWSKKVKYHNPFSLYLITSLQKVNIQIWVLRFLLNLPGSLITLWKLWGKIQNHVLGLFLLHYRITRNLRSALMLKSPKTLNIMLIWRLFHRLGGDEYHRFKFKYFLYLVESSRKKHFCSKKWASGLKTFRYRNNW